MKDDLIERLRQQDGGWHVEAHFRNPDGPEAAARIEKLEAALREIMSGSHTPAWIAQAALTSTSEASDPEGCEALSPEEFNEAAERHG